MDSTIRVRDSRENERDTEDAIGSSIKSIDICLDPQTSVIRVQINLGSNSDLQRIFQLKALYEPDSAIAWIDHEIAIRKTKESLGFSLQRTLFELDNPIVYLEPSLDGEVLTRFTCNSVRRARAKMRSATNVIQ